MEGITDSVAALCGQFLAEVTPLLDAASDSYASECNAGEVEEVVAFMTKWEPLMRFVGTPPDTATRYDPNDAQESLRLLYCACGATETRAMAWMEEYYPAQCPWLYGTQR